MKRIKFICFIILIIFSAANAIEIYAQDDQCFICHEVLGDKPSELFKSDVHFKIKISCAACHGGNSKSDDMEIAMSSKEGFIGIPKGDDISERCIACHSNAETMKGYGSNVPVNQLELIKHSVHWKSSVTAKERILQCTTCHNAHGILRVSNAASPVHSLNLPNTCSRCHSNAAYMRNYNPSLPVDQLQKYRTSGHGILNSKRDAKAADCADCHGTHEIRPAEDIKSKVYPTNIPKTCAACHSDTEYMKGYKIPTDQYEKYKTSVHGTALFEKNDLSAPVCNSCHGNHGAAPPGVESISKVCGTCHVLNAELFSGSPHKKAFDEKNYPECETCHKNHDIVTATNALLGVSDEAVCSQCHSDSENVKGFKSAKEMRSLIDSLDQAIFLAKELINDAEQKGMEISEAKFKLRDAQQAKLEARTMVHSFNLDKFKEVVEVKGLVVASGVIDEAAASIDNYYFRRYGLVVSILIISALALFLYLYVKKIESKNSR